MKLFDSGAGSNFALGGIRREHKTGEWGRCGLIALLVICLGLATPLKFRIAFQPRLGEPFHSGTEITSKRENQ